MKKQLTTSHMGTAALGCPVERSSTAFTRKSIRLLLNN